MILDNMEITSETIEDNAMDDKKDLTKENKGESILTEGEIKSVEKESNESKNVIDIVDITEDNKDRCKDKEKNIEKESLSANVLKESSLVRNERNRSLDKDRDNNDDDKIEDGKDIVDDSFSEVLNDTEDKLEIVNNLNKDNSISENRSSPSLATNKSNNKKINCEENKGESINKDGRRKRRMSSIQSRSSSLEKSDKVNNKRKQLKNDEDKFCWRCHKESVDSHCTACPRSWHRRCMGGGPQPSSQNWICGECATILKAENAETRSPAMSQLSVEQLCTLLKHVVGRMRDCQGSEPFWKAVDLNEVPNYLEYVVKPMDLSLLESNVRSKLYGSTEAFMADAKWIQHNCIVFNTCGGVYADTSKLTNAARQIIKAARQEVSEIEACSDCYGHARNLPRPQPSWFIEPCRRPHPLVWAKLKGFPFWPAKAMSRLNGQGHVDVRFFGAHDRAWVPPRDLYLYSENPPAPLPRKRKSDMDDCVKEITRHCRKLELTFGQFKFAPPKVQYNPRDPTQIKLMLPNYDPMQQSSSLDGNNIVNEFSSSVSPEARRKPQLRKRSSVMVKANSVKKRKRKIMSNVVGKGSKDNGINSCDDFIDSSSTIGCEKNINDNFNEDCEKYIEATRISKVSTSSSSLDKLNNEDDDYDKKNKGKIVINDKKRRHSIASSCFEDGATVENNNKSFDNKSSECNSSSENELSLETRQTMRKESSLSYENRCDDVGVVDGKRSKISHNSSSSSNKIEKGKDDPVVVINNNQESKLKLKINHQKSNRNQVRVYKPKTRMVNQVNAERAKNEINNKIDYLNNSKKNEESLSSSASVNFLNKKPSLKLIKKNESSDSYSPIILPDDGNYSTVIDPLRSCEDNKTNSLNKINDSSNRFKSSSSTVIPSSVKQENNQHHHTPHKKESKARKSFLNKTPVFPQIDTLSRSPQKPPQSPPDAMVYIPGHRSDDNKTDYLLIPPEAGPLSAQIYRGGQELARRMAELMEEAFAEAAQIHSIKNDNDDYNSNQIATVHHLKLQIERMRWQHQQHLAELKHNTDLTLREMRASLEAERYRAIEETKREAEEDRLRSIEETKRKQWCALCGNEALFYCCWNTAYCDYPCQQQHWSTHMRTCAQNLPPNTVINATASVNQQQQQQHQQQQQQQQQQQIMPRLVITSPHASSNVWGA